ncbi:Hypothetical protein D9617_23g006030 [Elsinoe fawcettii]|nr:Hypothetical protein D9617_23g006030 [Elsinoe fawcettii]
MRVFSFSGARALCLTLLFLALTQLALAVPADPVGPVGLAAKKGCSASDPALIVLKKNIGAPGDFCGWWGSSKRDWYSPIPDVSARALTRVCKCVTRTPSLIGPTKTRAVYTPTATSAVKHLNLLRKSVYHPFVFCRYWLRSSQSTSPFFALSPKQVSDVCSKVVASPKLVNKNPKTTAKPQKGTGKKTTKKVTATKKGRKTSKGVQTTALHPSPSAFLNTTTSSVPLPTGNSTAGTTFEASKVELKPAETAVLTAMAPPGTDLTSLDNLTPSKNASLYFAGAPSDNSSAGTAAALDMKFAYPSVVLDHTVFITSVSCSESVMRIQYNNKEAYTHASDSWKKDNKVILITASDSCGLNASSTVFVSTSFTFDDAGMIAKVKGAIQDMSTVYASVSMDFGSVDMSNVTYVPPSCGSLPANASLKFPTSDCGSNFDSNLDQKLGYYSGADADQASVLAIIAPSNSTATSLQKRLFGSIIKAISAPVKAVAKTVATTAAKVLPASVNNAIKQVTNVVSSGVSALKSLVPPLNYSKTISIPLNIGPPQKDPSPWGNQFKFFSWSPSDPSTIAATQKKLDAVKGSLQGVSNPKPSIDMFCVDCGIKGQLNAVGSISASLTSGVTKCAIELNGNIYAGVYIGVNAFASYEKVYNKDLISQGLPSFSIPGIVTVGPKVTVSVQSKLKVNAEGQILVGASLNWPNIKANLDLLDKSKSYQSGFVPTIDKKFQAYGDLTAEASLGLPMTLFFGIDLLGGTIKKGVSLTDTPAVTASASLNVNANFGTGQSNSVTSKNGCFGIKYNVGASNDLSMDILGLTTLTLSHWENPALVAGCLGRKVPVVTTTTTTTTTTTEEPTPDPTPDAGDSPPTDGSGGDASTTADGSTPTDTPASPDDGSGGATTTADPAASPTPDGSSGSSPDTGGSGDNPNPSGGDNSNSGGGSGSGGSGDNAPATTTTTLATTKATTTTTTTTFASVSPTSNPNNPKCGDVYNTLDGRTWQINCKVDYPGQDLVHKPFANITSCIDYCNDYGSACKAVIWVQRGLDQQQCFLKSSTAVNGTVASGLTAFAASPVTYSPLQACPAAHNQAFLDASGQVYQIKCATDYSGYDLGSFSGYNTMEKCIDYCDTDPDCKGVSYAYNGTYRTPFCYPKYKMTDAPLNSSVYKYKMDSAVKISRPVYKALGACPAVDNTNFYDKLGNTYKISCGVTYDDNDIVQKDGMKNLEECLNSCDSTDSCIGVSYAYGGYYGSNPACFLKSAQNANPRNASAFSFSVDSAFLITTRGSRKMKRSKNGKAHLSTTTTSSILVSTVIADSSVTNTVSSLTTAVSVVTTKGKKGSFSTYTSSLTSTVTTSSNQSLETAHPNILADVVLNVTITDASKTFQLLPGDDGSIYLSTNYTADSATTPFVYEDGIITADIRERYFLYFPDLMSTYGASRFRLAKWGKIPIGARIITLMPLTVDGKTVLVATDTLGNYFFPITCAYDGNANLKVFLVKDSSGDLSFMTDKMLRFVMTGGVVSECNPVSLTADGVGTLAATPPDTSADGGDGSTDSSSDATTPTTDGSTANPTDGGSSTPTDGSDGSS